MTQIDIKFSRKTLKQAEGIEQLFTGLGVPKKAAVFINERTMWKLIKQFRSVGDSEEKTLNRFAKEAKKYRIVLLNKVKRNSITVVS